jgi:hypothetical protein
MSRLALRLLLAVVFAAFGFTFGFGLAIMTIRMTGLALFCGLFTAGYGLLLSLVTWRQPQQNDTLRVVEESDDYECDDDNSPLRQTAGKGQKVTED